MLSACVIFCDDIRRENTGKDILIGVYHRAAVIEGAPSGAPPSPILMRAYVILDGIEPGPARELSLDLAARLEQTPDGDMELGQGRMSIGIAASERPQRINLPLPPIPVPVIHASRLTISLAMKGQEISMSGASLEIRVHPGGTAGATNQSPPPAASAVG